MTETKYRIDVIKDGVALCQITLGGNGSYEPLDIVLDRFPETDGFVTHVFVAKKETRFLRSDEDGIKVLAVVPEYERFLRD